MSSDRPTPREIHPVPPRIPRPAKRTESHDDPKAAREAEELERQRVERFRADQEAVRQAVASVRTVPKVEAESPPVSVPPAADQALGKAVRTIIRQFGAPLLMAALGAGGAVVARPAAAPERVDATAARVTELEARLKREREERLESDDQARALRRVLRCLRDANGDAFDQLLPPADRLARGSAPRLRPWSDDCGPIPP